MANDELDALNALEKEAKEYDKVWVRRYQDVHQADVS